jgi:hypothetical protein
VFRNANIVTVTKVSDSDRCGWCRRPLAQNPGKGRRRKFCSRSHRQRAYEARRRSESFGVPAGQVIVLENELERVLDRLYRLETAIEDVEADLAGSNEPAAYKEALEHLLDAARDLSGVAIEPARG